MFARHIYDVIEEEAAQWPVVDLTMAYSAVEAPALQPLEAQHSRFRFHRLLPKCVYTFFCPRQASIGND